MTKSHKERNSRQQENKCGGILCVIATDGEPKRYHCIADTDGDCYYDRSFYSDTDESTN